MMKQLWADEGGAILSAELILLMTILVVGMIAGLKALESAVVTELADVAAAIGSLNQSYQFAGTQDLDPRPNAGQSALMAQTAGSLFADALDSDDDPANTAGAGVQGISVGVAPPTVSEVGL